VSAAAAETARPVRRASARDTVRCVLVAALLLVLLAGDSVRPAARELEPGPIRDVVHAVGGPTGAVAEALPFAAAADQVTGWLSPGADAGAGAEQAPVATTGAGAVDPEAFAPAALGEPAQPRRLASLLVTGDSMAQPLDATLARRLADRGVRVRRDPQLGTGISKPFLVDWRALAAEQAREVRPDAVVVFLGANEGFPFETRRGEVRCCGAAWAAEYATRARVVMERYRRGGRTRVFWTLLPAPRDRERARVARAVNAAVRVAAGAFGAQVTLVDAAGLFTPGGRYREALEVGGREVLVRDADGIHLNRAGAELLTDTVIARLGEHFAA